MGKVFISYSHDSPDHSERVLALSNALRARGVDAELDRYHVRPPQGWPHWCEEQLRPEVSSFVLVVCTPNYRARVEGRVSADEGRGVYWEGAILYNYLYNAKENTRFIPVLLDDAPELGVPLPLDGHTRYRLRAFALTDSSFAALYRELIGQPETPKPTLGEVVDLGGAGATLVNFPTAAADLSHSSQAKDDALVAWAPNPANAETTDAGLSVVGFWSPFSDEESVARGEIRFLAIVETCLAMAVFWWVAIRYETFLLLTTSLFVAPMLLLRSEESTRLGVKWFHEGETERSRDGSKLLKYWLWIGAVIGIAITVGLCLPSAKIFLVGYQGWSAFGRGFLFTIILPSISMAIIFIILHVMLVFWRGIYVIVVMVSIWTTVLAALAVVVAVAGVAAIAGATAGAVLCLIFTLSMTVSIWALTVVIRIAATIWCLPQGYRQIPANIMRVALSMTPLQQPQLLPGLPADHPLHFLAIFATLRQNFRGSGLVKKSVSTAHFVIAPSIYLPAWAYRFILKSTLWFWWLLIIVGGAPRVDGGIEGLRADAYRKATAWVGIATTLFAVAGFGFGWLLKPYAENLASHAPLPAAVALLVLVDWNAVPFVQWVTLASALMTIAVIIWTRDLVVDVSNPRRARKVAAQIPLLGQLVKWKSFFGAVAIALLMLYIFLYALAVHQWLPSSEWLAGWLHRLYGTAAERLRG